MKKILFIIVLTCFISSMAQASELIDNRIYFSSTMGMGYIVEKFVVPDGKTCLTSIKTESMDKDGGYNIAISNVAEDGSPLFTTIEWYEANSGTITVDMKDSPLQLSPGMEIMAYVVPDRKVPKKTK